MKMHKIVIVGGGAGGLELATKLGDTLGKKKKAEITLIDCTKTHVWKPLLHEIAAGSMNPDKHELEYMAQAHWHHFRFRLGRMDRLNRRKKEVSIAPYVDEDGKEIIPRRSFQYDTLIISVGHQKLHHAILKAQTQKKPIQPGQLEVVIVGAGATGVELAAELHKATREMTAYGIDRVNPDRDIKISIIEASPRLLPALPKKLSHSVELELRKLRVHLYMGERVIEVSAKGVKTHSKRFIPSALVVWAAGVKAPDFLKKIDGLETNHINQLLVHTTLQTTRDDSIFAFGDCAACPIDSTDQFVPPRAQAAHQQASLLFKSMKMRVKGKMNLPQYVYKDYGSLVNMGEYSTVGNLMGSLMGGSMFIEGFIARLMYQSLYKMHLMALHGFMSTALQTLARIITRRTEAQVKLH
ncbi:MAG: NAD(P)/FAD-dependent oxidoreductase [Methylophilaceae bacterium]|nr:NAD(P)/FAD-dependent oxidoreductase [Methylophilaceae bacterium]